MHPNAALARDPTIAIPATTLDIALTTLGRETDTEIISTEPGLRAIATPPVRGAMSVRRALDRLLSGTGFRAVAVAGGGYRIVRGRPRRAQEPPRPRRPHPTEAIGDVVVTGSKQRVTLLRYPGSVTIIDGTGALGTGGASDMSRIAASTPILQSTQLGPGRNKLFIRGIADSSFNGSTQATASVYLDDVQIAYSGADPGLRLYDMQRVEVLEGAQGTLYGAGAIGGVVRLTSNPPDLGMVHGSLFAGLTATARGEPGFDLAGTVNLPLVTDTLGLRGVAYRARDGGYLDDRRRGLSDINRTDTVGGRLALRADPGDGWRIDMSGVAQQIDGRDGQYAQTGVGPLARRSFIAQPYANRLAGGRLVATKDWPGGLRLVSATGVTGQTLDDRFDATAAPPAGMPAIISLYETHTEKLLLTQETRLSRSLAGGGSWVAGFTLLRDQDRLSRSVGSPGGEVDIIGVTNMTRSASLFGESTIALRPSLAATIGARFTIARIDGDPSSKPRSAAFVKGRSTRRFDPTLAVSWTIAPRLAAFARYQTGYRTGGLSVARGVGRVADFSTDSIRVGELGIRRLRHGTTGLTFSTSMSIAHWVGIQADLINTRGAPYTLNLGDARIETLEGSVGWAPLPGLEADLAFLYTHNSVTGTIADLSKRDNRRLADTPPLAAHGALGYAWAGGHDVRYRLQASADYIGRSVLGTGDLLDVSQGDYVTVGVVAGATRHGVQASIAIDNATGTTANRFAFGNQFGVAARNQTTPLRPFNIRAGIAFGW